MYCTEVAFLLLSLINFERNILVIIYSDLYIDAFLYPDLPLYLL
jgi:hypothetical protein